MTTYTRLGGGLRYQYSGAGVWSRLRAENDVSHDTHRVHASNRAHKRFMAQPLFIFAENPGQEAVWQRCGAS
jgi:hypothetical protein